MVLHFLSCVLALLQLAFASPSQVVLSGDSGGGSSLEDPYATSITSARENANDVFNAIHSALRQFGSSIRHNGVSFFPATVPEGTLLYHGSESAEAIESLEWLAFEITHAEMFARGFPLAPKGSEARARARDVPLNEETLTRWMGDGGNDYMPGYLHIYRTNRPLKLLYFDGMSAAKCDKGPMELQDILVDHVAGLGYWMEAERAEGLCSFGAQHGIEGFIRMETGFELIKCDFQTGLDVVSVKKRPTAINQPEGVHTWTLLEYVRDTSMRYMGNMGGRVRVDFSNMVSAFFYPANLTNADMGPKYPKLSSAEPEQRLRMKNDLVAILTRTSSTTTTKATSTRETTTTIDWQSVVDMITARYSDRLQYLATDPPHAEFLGLVNNLLNLYIDYDHPTIGEEASIHTCAGHYLLPITPVTESDHLIHTSISTVTYEICRTLFAARAILLERERNHPTPPDDTDREFSPMPSSSSSSSSSPSPSSSFPSSSSLPSSTSSSPLNLILDLNTYLDWTSWRYCPQTCTLDEVCFTAMFPFGREEDHERPSCKGNEAMMEASLKTDLNYWWPRGGRMEERR